MPLKTATITPPPAVVHHAEGRFYIGMAIAALATSLAGFGPAIVDPASRREPLTLAVAVHGVIFGAWLLLFLTQALLALKGRFAGHRKLGYVGAVLAVLVVVSGYMISIAMARRGYDLSGDLTGDPVMLLVFQLGDLLCFGALVAAAILFRRRPDVHKRLMLLATVGGLMSAPLSHIIGHSSFLRGLHPTIILIPFIAFLFAGAVHDRLSRGRIHPVSLWVALAVFVWSNFRAVVIGPSDAWREFATWLIR